MPRTKKPTAHASPTGSAQLRTWLTALPAPLIDAPATDLLSELAVQHRERMLDLLRDLQVAECVDRSVQTAVQSCSPAVAVRRVAQLLVDACWVSQASSSPQWSPAIASSSADSRTERFRELKAAAKAAQTLGKRLKSLMAPSLTANHLLSRLAAGNPTLFAHQRKGWKTALPKTASPLASDLLEALASELAEEAALLGLSIEKNRQPGSSRKGINTLIDPLLQQSVQLGAKNHKGEPVPDFDLIHAVVTSMHPNDPPDITTAKKRWANRQRKLKPKNP